MLGDILVTAPYIFSGENDYDDDEGKESEGEAYIDEDLMNIN